MCAAVGLAPLGLWLLRNQLLIGSPTGFDEFPVARDPIRIYQNINDELTKWVFLELPIERWFGTGQAGAALVVAFVAAFAFHVVRRERVRRSLLVFGGFVLAHSALLAAVTAWVFQTRYLAPVYFPILAVVWLVVNAAFRQTARAAVGSWIAVAIASTWLAYQGTMHKHAIVTRNISGWYYDGPRWRDSETLRHLDVMVANNRVHTFMSAPAFFHSRVRLRRHSCSEILVEGEDSYLLWLEQVPDPCLLIGRHETFAIPGWDLVANFADGALLRFNPASDATLADAVWAHFAPNGPLGRQAFWHLRVDGRRLVYVKSSCGVTDTAPRFFLHIQARSNDTLPPHRRRYGFDNLDFQFAQHGLELPGDSHPGSSRRCVAIVELPGYPLASLRTGQYDEQPLWTAHVDFNADDGASALRLRSRPGDVPPPRHAGE